VREVSIYGLLLYGVPVLVIVVTLYVGYLGFKFYVDEVIKK
jgi:hypothetical protein